MTEPAKLNTIYESEELLALNKPAGMPSVPLEASPKGSTAFHAAIDIRPEIAKIGSAARQELEGGTLHRLDTSTSGAILFAKTQDAFDRFRQQWSSIRKIYRARVTSKYQQLPKSIETPLANSKKSAAKMVGFHPGKISQIRGRPLEAKTLIHEQNQIDLETFDLSIEILTGVRHQIRCHLAINEAPIIGDMLYGGRPAKRMYLHAHQLILPGGIVIEAPLPF